MDWKSAAWFKSLSVCMEVSRKVQPWVSAICKTRQRLCHGCISASVVGGLVKISKLKPDLIHHLECVSFLQHDIDHKRSATAVTAHLDRKTYNKALSVMDWANYKGGPGNNDFYSLCLGAVHLCIFAHFDKWLHLCPILITKYKKVRGGSKSFTVHMLFFFHTA